MPSQNWFFKNNLRVPVSGQDYVLLGNLENDDPGGPLNTAAARTESFTRWELSESLYATLQEYGLWWTVQYSGGETYVDRIVQDANGIVLLGDPAGSAVTVNAQNMAWKIPEAVEGSVPYILDASTGQVGFYKEAEGTSQEEVDTQDRSLGTTGEWVTLVTMVLTANYPDGRVEYGVTGFSTVSTAFEVRLVRDAVPFGDVDRHTIYQQQRKSGNWVVSAGFNNGSTLQLQARIAAPPWEVIIRGASEATRLKIQRNPNDELREQVLHAWSEDPISGDLFPDGFSPDFDAGIGIRDKSPEYVAVGGQGTMTAEGLMTHRHDGIGGGLRLMGFRQSEPGEARSAAQGNAALELDSPHILLNGPTWIYVPLPVAEDHYLILGPSHVALDGNHYCPLLIGPRVVYSFSESAQDVQDHEIVSGHTTGPAFKIVSLTLANSYAAGDSTFSFAVNLSEEGGRQVDFEVIIEADTVEISKVMYSVSGGQQYILQSFSVQNPISAGTVIDMKVRGTGSHVGSDGWVRGTMRLSEIKMQQG